VNPRPKTSDVANSIYKINRGIHKSVEFKGLKAQYIGLLGGGILVLFILFATLYITGMHPVFCLFFIVAAGICLFLTVFKMSRKYGEFGLMKKLARRRVPRLIKCNSRRLFLKS